MLSLSITTTTTLDFDLELPEYASDLITALRLTFEIRDSYLCMSGPKGYINRTICYGRDASNMVEAIMILISDVNRRLYGY